jgi:rubrerythrin
MRERHALEIGSIEETEIEPLDEGIEEVVDELPHPPIWHRRCRHCGLVFNVLKVKCPICRKR